MHSLNISARTALGFRPALGLTLVAAACVLGAPVRGEDKTTDKPVADEAKPAAAGERPRVRYWLKDPSQAAPPDQTKGDEKDPSPTADTPAPKPNLSSPDGRRQAMAQQFKKMLDQAEAALDHRDYEGSVQICRNVLTADPRNERAVDILSRAHHKLANSDQKITDAASERKDHEALLEADEHSVRPPVRTPETRPQWPCREDDPVLPKQQKMASALDVLVSVDFLKADLDWVFNTLFIMTGVNIIADPAAIEGKKLTLHVDKIPLREVLDFIVRNNDGIQYSATEYAIWITATSASDLKKVMVPRVYPLHHGLVSMQPNTN
ncbi:MAG: hypothetical protein HY291_06295 [Planctomycetes bacterium]|nr:hypothetical protein [Planctomycetota bacterium]